MVLLTKLALVALVITCGGQENLRGGNLLRWPSCGHVWSRVIVPLEFFLKLNPPSKRELPFPLGLNHMGIMFIAR